MRMASLTPRELLGPFYTILRYSPYNLSSTSNDSNNNRIIKIFRLLLGIAVCAITFIRLAVSVTDASKQPLSAAWGKLNIMMFAVLYATSTSIVLCFWTRQRFFNEFCDDLTKVQQHRIHPINMSANSNRKCHIVALILSIVFACVWMATFILEFLDYCIEIRKGNSKFIETLYKFVLNPIVYPLAAISTPLITTIYYLINRSINNELQDFNADLKDAVITNRLQNDTSLLAQFNNRHQSLVEFILKSNRQLIKPLLFGPLACVLCSANAVFVASAFENEIPMRDVSIYFFWIPCSIVTGVFNLAPPGHTQALLREVKNILLSADLHQDNNSETYSLYKSMLRRCDIDTRLTVCGGAAYIDPAYTAKVFWIGPNVGSLMTIVKKLMFPDN
ncbi:hypothetical protein WR25_19255 isoform A [Diploscapter pachys]|uniref:Gustatory receptor n=2 Tax=Diploscapter pachys TaxID=2018661 RepID=A0A2A2L7L3_9BILA|nr:hypothetical protein WR25_19255 isoform A [Diploscapter pachys]